MLYLLKKKKRRGRDMEGPVTEKERERREGKEKKKRVSQEGPH